MPRPLSIVGEKLTNVVKLADACICPIFVLFFFHMAYKGCPQLINYYWFGMYNITKARIVLKLQFIGGLNFENKAYQRNF